MGSLLRNLPYLVVLALAIFGVAYSNFSGRPINGYWEFLAIAMGLLCIFLGWPNAPDRETRIRLVWTQVAHWTAIIVAINLVLLQGFQQLMPVQAAGLVLMLLLGLGTFLAGIEPHLAQNLFSRPRHGAVHSGDDMAEAGVAPAAPGWRRHRRIGGRLLAARAECLSMRAASLNEATAIY